MDLQKLYAFHLKITFNTNTASISNVSNPERSGFEELTFQDVD